MASIFTRIIEGELPGTFVWKDDRAVAFLPINPLGRSRAHRPPQEIDHWLDCPADLRDHLVGVAAEIGQAPGRLPADEVGR